MAEIILANLSDISGFSANGTTLTGSAFTAVNPGVYYINQSAAFTFTLPTPANVVTNAFFIIKDTGQGTTYHVTIVATGGTLIDGAATKVITVNYGKFWLSYNGANWSVLGT